MTDFILLEQLYKMIKEIPKPALFHRKGIRVSGYFRPYMDFSDYTKAHMFSSNDVVTPVDIRFSSMLGDDGTPDTVRNIKGMEVKFKDESNEHDMFCRNLPLSLTSNSEDLIDIIKAFSVNKAFDMINNQALWRYVCDNYEALNFVIRLFSGYGLTDSFINIQWYSVNIFIWENMLGKKTLVKYKWTPLCDMKERNLTEGYLKRSKAEFVAGYDCNRASNELINMIDRQKYPGLELQIQMIDMSRPYDDHYLNRTLIWNEEEIPYRAVGILRINNYFNELYDGEKLVHSACNNMNGIRVKEDELSELNDYLTKIVECERSFV